MAVKYAILGLLHYQDMHGYRIKKHMERNFGHMWTINYGQIFKSLKDMEEEGLVSMQKVVPSEDGGPHKKLYSITPRGREEFARWLASAPEKGMLIRDPFLLRFVFFGFGERGKALEIIDEQIRIYGDQLRRRKENISRWQHHNDYVRLTAELGLQFNQAYLDWLKQARKEIASGANQSVGAETLPLPH